MLVSIHTELAANSECRADSQSPIPQVSFEPIPSAQTLQSRLPSGRAALSLKPYTAPSPSFRPRAVGSGALPPSKAAPPPPPKSLDAAMAGMGIGGAGAGHDSSDEEDGEEDTVVGDYFGAGQYF